MKSAVLTFSVFLLVSCNALSLQPDTPIDPSFPIGPIRPIEPIDPVGPIEPVRCGPVCFIYCPNGNVLDSRGCPTCRCNQEDKCSVSFLRSCRFCRYGRTYYTDRNGCRRCRCKPRIGPICPVYKRDPCEGKVCPNGFLKDSRGCPTCKCKPKIIDLCPSKPCSKKCKNGYLKGRNGCDICICKPGGGRSCLHNGKTYRDGQSFKDNCNRCFCRNGRALCTKRACPNIECPLRKCSSCPLNLYRRDSKGCRTCECRIKIRNSSLF